MFSLMAIHMFVNYFHPENVAMICGNLSLTVGSTVTSTRMLQNWRKRHILTSILKEVNEKVQKSRSIATWEQNKKSNDLHLMLCNLTIIELALTISYSASLGITTLITGEFYYPMAVPWKGESYSFSWWFEFVFIQIHLIYFSLYYPLMEATVVDPILQISYLFGVQYDKLANYRGTEWDKNFNEVAKELHNLKR